MEDELVVADTTPRWKRAGPPYLMTRAELIEELATWQYRVTDRQLKSWATYGLLPPPIRQVPPGATDGKPRALYRPWVIGAVMDLLARLRKGETVEDLKPIAPSLWKDWQEYEHGFLPADADRSHLPRRGIPDELYDKLQDVVWACTKYLAEHQGKIATDVSLKMQFTKGPLFIYEFAPRKPPPKSD
jgi:hypothetical protein